MNESERLREIRELLTDVTTMTLHGPLPLKTSMELATMGLELLSLHERDEARVKELEAENRQLKEAYNLSGMRAEIESLTAQLAAQGSERVAAEMRARELVEMLTRDGWLNPETAIGCAPIIAAALTTQTPDVEGAMIELRDLFPNAAVSVQFSSADLSGHLRFWCYLRRKNKIIAHGSTLTEAMNQVREWKERGEKDGK